jgi:hypothetical protein
VIGFSEQCSEFAFTVVRQRNLPKKNVVVAARFSYLTLFMPCYVIILGSGSSYVRSYSNWYPGTVWVYLLSSEMSRRRFKVTWASPNAGLHQSIISPGYGIYGSRKLKRSMIFVSNIVLAYCTSSRCRLFGMSNGAFPYLIQFCTKPFSGF